MNLRKGDNLISIQGIPKTFTSLCLCNKRSLELYSQNHWDYCTFDIQYCSFNILLKLNSHFNWSLIYVPWNKTCFVFYWLGWCVCVEILRSTSPDKTCAYTYHFTVYKHDAVAHWCTCKYNSLASLIWRYKQFGPLFVLSP